MTATVFKKNKQANAIAYDKASIHTGSPGVAGASNEVSGGSPAYARKAITVGTASNGLRQATSFPEFDIPAGTTITHFALWEGVNCTDTGTLSSSESYTGQGVYTLTSGDLLNT